MNITLHFFYEPSSRSARAAEPVLSVLAEMEGLELELHCASLATEPGRWWTEDSAETTGAAALALDLAGVFETRPLLAAVLAAQSLEAKKGFDMLRGLELGFEQHGLNVVAPEILRELVRNIGLDADAFESAYRDIDVDRHIEATRRLSARCGLVTPRPFALELGDEWIVVPHWQFQEKPDAIRAWLEQEIETRSRHDLAGMRSL